VPVYKTTLDASVIPWSVIDSDLDDHDIIFPEAANGLSTASNDFRRDLDTWASPFRNSVEQIIKLFMPYITQASYTDYTKKSWINRLGPNGYARYHNHIPCDLAIVWYINAPENCGNFILNFNDCEHVVEIKTGDLIAFPASLLHTTQTNQSGQNRYVMATNIVWTENMRLRMNGRLTNEQIDILYMNRQSQLTREIYNWNEKNATHISN
jgi:hypothetical protein